MAIAKERLFFNEDKTKLVKENDPDAKILAAAVGDEIPDVPNKVVKGEVVEKDTDADDDDLVVGKSSPKPANKASKAEGDK